MPVDGTMDVVIGEKDDYLWGFVRVVDDVPVFRDTNTLSLDRADHLRLSFIRADGVDP